MKTDIEKFAELTGHDLCPRCKCCDLVWEECSYCGGEGGRGGEDLMEEDPLWYSEEDFIECDVCNGAGGFYECLGNCDENGKHAHDIAQPAQPSDPTKAQ